MSSIVSRTALVLFLVAGSAHAQTSAQLVAQLDGAYAHTTSYRADVTFATTVPGGSVATSGPFAFTRPHEQFGFTSLVLRVMSDGTRICSSSGGLPARTTVVQTPAQSAWWLATTFLRGLASSGFAFTWGGTLLIARQPGSTNFVTYTVDPIRSQVTAAMVSESAGRSYFTFANERLNEPVGPQTFTAPIWGTNLIGVANFTKVCP